MEPGGDVRGARIATRPVYFAETGGYVRSPIYDRDKLGAGSLVDGPAIVQELNVTTLVHPDYRAEVDRLGNLMIAPLEPSAAAVKPIDGANP